MKNKEFKEKFLKLFKIFSEDKEKESKFSEAKTLENCYGIACEFVGHMDFELFKSSMKKLAEKNREKKELTEEDLEEVAGGSVLDVIGGALGLESEIAMGNKIGSLIKDLF